MDIQYYVVLRFLFKGWAFAVGNAGEISWIWARTENLVAIYNDPGAYLYLSHHKHAIDKAESKNWYKKLYHERIDAFFYLADKNILKLLLNISYLFSFTFVCVFRNITNQIFVYSVYGHSKKKVKKWNIINK